MLALAPFAVCFAVFRMVRRKSSWRICVLPCVFICQAACDHQHPCNSFLTNSFFSCKDRASERIGQTRRKNKNQGDFFGFVAKGVAQRFSQCAQHGRQWRTKSEQFFQNILDKQKVLFRFCRRLSFSFCSCPLRFWFCDALWCRSRSCSYFSACWPAWRC